MPSCCPLCGLAVPIPQTFRGFGLGFEEGQVGAVWVLLAAAGVAAGNVLLKRLGGSIDPWMAMGVQLVLGSVPLFAASETLEPRGTVVWSGMFLIAPALLAVFGTALASLVWFRLLQGNELNRVNTYTFLTPVFALLIGMFFLASVCPACNGWVHWSWFWQR